jgi:hypothetical protein
VRVEWSRDKQLAEFKGEGFREGLTPGQSHQQDRFHRKILAGFSGVPSRQPNGTTHWILAVLDFGWILAGKQESF